MNTFAIRTHDLHFAYTDGTQALDGVTFDLRPGEKTALVGPNGAGKSTLLLALGGFVGSQGRIEVGGVTLEKSVLASIRRRLGIVFQNPDHQLFMPTVEEDVAFGPMNMGLAGGELEEAITAAMAKTGVTHLRRKSAHHLSIGEKRRVAIATVLSMSPEILILDEPSSNLDPRMRRSLITLLRSMDQTLLVAGHDLEMLLEVCPRTILIDAGRVVAHGETRELFADAALMETHGLEVPGVLRAGH